MKKKIFLLCMLFTGILGGCAAPSDNFGDTEGAEGEVLTVVERVQLDSDLGAMNHVQIVGDTLYYVRYEAYDADPDSEQIKVYFCRQQGEGPERQAFTCMTTRKTASHFKRWTADRTVWGRR